MEKILESTLLDLWERYAHHAPVERTLALVAIACPKEHMETLIDWPIGRRDSLLLEFREKLFGEQLAAMTRCPQCSKDVELIFETSSIRTHHASATPFKLEFSGQDGKQYQIELRAISSRDLMGSVVDRNSLLRRCIVAVNYVDVQLDPALSIEISEDIESKCVQALAECDPQADVQLELVCADCGFSWDAPFDIATYLWREIEIWADQTLRQVHLLASAYGWSEQQILELTPQRRRSYLEMVVE